MEGPGRQSRLLGRLFGKLRGEHHKYTSLDKTSSVTSDGLSDSTGCGSSTNNNDYYNDQVESSNTTPPQNETQPITNEFKFSANIDLRYGGQYLTPEQLPEFCNQLRHLIEVIRNIQSYAKVTGEYPSELERRLEQEALEVASLAAEARNARDVISIVRTQRKAVRVQKKQLMSHLASLRETEIRELESTVRLSDRKLFKSWESLKDSNDPSGFEPLLSEIRSKQTALDCLIRLIESRTSALTRNKTAPRPLPVPEMTDYEESSETTSALGSKKRYESGGRRSSYKRRRRESAREPRSVPLSVEPSRHGPAPTQVTLYIQGRSESTSQNRVPSSGAVTLTPLDLPSTGSVRDILFFTTN